MYLENEGVRASITGSIFSTECAQDAQRSPNRTSLEQHEANRSNAQNSLIIDSEYLIHKAPKLACIGHSYSHGHNNQRSNQSLHNAGRRASPPSLKLLQESGKNSHGNHVGRRSCHRSRDDYIRIQSHRFLRKRFLHQPINNAQKPWTPTQPFESPASR